LALLVAACFFISTAAAPLTIVKTINDIYTSLAFQAAEVSYNEQE
jgi:hypothetical protein